MYITGSVGSRAAGEAFGEPYELPNAQAYTESCAAIGNLFWNWRLLAATADARHADLIERALYNGVNSGMSLDGTLYCYRNPLELGLENIRNPWYDTTCCPPNLQRILASLPGYLYSTSPDGVYVHLYHSSTMDWNGLRLEQKTKYPWEGAVEISLTPGQPHEFTVFLRIPAWSSAAKVTVNGKPWQGQIRPGEYLALRRAWRPGDRILLTLDVRPRLTVANPRLKENTGRVAVEMGPLLYCIEQTDQQGVPSLHDAALLPEGGFHAVMRTDLLGGLLLLEHKAVVYDKPLSEEPLYQTLGQSRPRSTRPVTLNLIPYYAFANRGPTQMQVWLPYLR
jgi:hypothetical protein